MENNIVNIKQLSHRYTSNTWAIRDISFDIRRTGIVGLLGSNGAGKSTTMNILCGVLNQTDGIIHIDGIDLRKDPGQAKKRIGFLPQTPPLYPDLTINEYLTFCAHIRFVDKTEIPRAVEEVKERCGITRHSNRLIRSLSGGFRQRVGIAQAIIHRPALVVLDEPTNGLDPNQIIEVRSLIREIATDRAVLFSSHILAEIQLLCQEIRMIENGRLVFSDTMESFNNYTRPNSVVITLENPPSEADLVQIAGVIRVDYLTTNRIRLYVDTDQQITERIILTSVQRGWRMQEIFKDRSSLDDIFSQLSHKS